MGSRYSGLKVLPGTQAEIQSPVLVKLHYNREIRKTEQGKKFLQVMTQRFHYRVGWVYGSEPEMRKNALVAEAWRSRTVHITAARKQRNRKGPKADSPWKVCTLVAHIPRQSPAFQHSTFNYQMQICSLCMDSISGIPSQVHLHADFAYKLVLSWSRLSSMLPW